MTTSNLSGSLSEFNVADVLALLAMGRRTARLQLTAGGAQGVIQLVDGQVSAATADATRAQLLRVVVTRLHVGSADLGRALQSPDPVHDLVDSGAVDLTDVREAASDQCTQALAEMLSWDSGTFEVWVGSVDAADVGVRLDPAGLVDSARTYIHDWRELQAALPETGSVLALAPEVTTAPAPDPGQWAVLARVDGRRTLGEVLAATGASPLSAGHRLADLLSSGLVRVRADREEADEHQLEALISGREADDALTADASRGDAPDFEPMDMAFERPVAEAEAAAVPPAPHAPVAPQAVPADSMSAGPDEMVAAGATAQAPDDLAAAASLAARPQVAPAEFAMPEDLPGPEDPVADLDEAGLEFAWSPWAQQMGLGGAPGEAVQEAPPSEPVARAHQADEHTADLPVPHAPAMAEAAPDPQLLPEAVPVAQEPWQYPPVADDGVRAHAAPGAQGAVPQSGAGLPTQEAEDGTGSAPAVPEPRAEAASSADPLAEGLLGHLMSGVRGL